MEKNRSLKQTAAHVGINEPDRNKPVSTVTVLGQEWCWSAIKVLLPDNFHPLLPHICPSLGLPSSSHKIQGE
jgi:hypothetical protein